MCLLKFVKSSTKTKLIFQIINLNICCITIKTDLWFDFCSPVSKSSGVSDIRAGLKDFIRGKKSIEPLKTELEEYLDEALDETPLEENFDILTWWKMKAAKYPVLSRLCRDVLAIPISTVASKTAFSTGGRVLSPVRNTLNDQSIEALICAQDWLKAQVRGQYT